MRLSASAMQCEAACACMCLVTEAAYMYACVSFLKQLTRASSSLRCCNPSEHSDTSHGWQARQNLRIFRAVQLTAHHIHTHENIPTKRQVAKKRAEQTIRSSWNAGLLAGSGCQHPSMTCTSSLGMSAVMGGRSLRRATVWIIWWYCHDERVRIA